MKINFNASRLSTAVKSTGAKIKAREIAKPSKSFVIDIAKSSLKRSGSLQAEDVNINLFSSIGGLVYYSDLWIVITSELSLIKKGGTYHITNCEASQALISEGAFDIFPMLKYYPTRKSLFTAIEKYSLEPCSKCLEKLDWDGFRTAKHWARQPVLERFKVSQFVETVESFEIERTFKLISPEFFANLPTDFPRLLQIEKKKSHWKCDSCNQEYSGFKNMFHLLPPHFNNKTVSQLIELAKRTCLPCLRIETPSIKLSEDEEIFLSEF